MTSCLIVDDSEAVRRVVRGMLESLDVSVEEAPSGAQALAVCKAKAPSAVVLDGRSADRAALDFLRDLRAQEGIDQPAVLFCPLEGESQQVREALDLGANEVLVRPFDRDLLRSKLTLAGVLQSH
ncbi:MAG: response regulator [Pseudomonadota bacterium]